MDGMTTTRQRLNHAQNVIQTDLAMLHCNIYITKLTIPNQYYTHDVRVANIALKAYIEI